MVITEQNRATVLYAIKLHANANYENGWDTVVECYEDAEIIEEVEREYYRDCTTIEQVIAAWGKILGEVAAINADRRADAINSAW